ncbi:hypothetical protein E2C01_045455 [Portunus trituberculatus]|uniref:Uncharacterized protein n=1 Tax=Portunus trituberculatus TaxID=210409 RepID=A0A5B7G193_PORTR|nr:hypothetical protein [Portunus trituberculatus]
MEAYIPHSFSQPKSSKPWFNTDCSRAIHDKEVAHKRLCLHIEYTHIPKRLIPSGAKRVHSDEGDLPQ